MRLVSFFILLIFTRVSFAQTIVSHRVPRGDNFLSATEYVPFDSQSTQSGPTFVMMHGFPDNQHLYDLIAPQIGAEFRSLTFDFLGWGDSDKPTDHVYNAASLYTDLNAVVEHFELEDVVLVVHDVSGHTGIDWALDNPEAVDGMVLLNTFYHGTATLEPPPGLGQFTAGNPQLEQVTQLALADDNFGISGIEEQTGEFIASDALRAEFVPLFGGERSLEIRPAFIELASGLVDELGERGTRVPELFSFQKPVQILFGAEDPYLNPGVAQSFADILSNNELTLIEGAHHYVQIDAADFVSQEILRFANTQIVPEPSRSLPIVLAVAFSSLCFRKSRP